MKRILFLTVGAVLLVAAAAHAQTIEVEELRCLPTGANGLVTATAANEPAGESPRLYFQWLQHGKEYWVEMEPAGGGKYWATFPKPEKRNQEVEYYATLVDSSGAEKAKSTVRRVKVNGNCPVELDPREKGVAANMTVGETIQKQQGHGVLGFLCDGIVTRINHQGVRRSDEICRACVFAWWFVPTVAGTALISPPLHVSPSRP